MLLLFAFRLCVCACVCVCVSVCVCVLRFVNMFEKILFFNGHSFFNIISFFLNALKLRLHFYHKY